MNKIKKYGLMILTVGGIAGAGIYGISQRGSYTNIQSDMNNIENLNVAELPEIMTENIEDMVSALQNCPVILQVKAESEREYAFYSAVQKVSVEKIYATDGNFTTGEQFEITSGKWMLSLDVEPASLECGYVNIMQPGKSYLIFLSEPFESLDPAEKVYQLYDELAIAPVFSIESCTNQVAVVDGETTYVPYKAVKDNEFFADSEQGIENLEKLKERLFSFVRIS